MSAAQFAQLIEQLQSLVIRHSGVLQTLKFMLTMGGKACGSYLVRLINESLNFWLRILQGLEERGEP
jgi:hypothetical protein